VNRVWIQVWLEANEDQDQIPGNRKDEGSKWENQPLVGSQSKIEGEEI
jgi:hypothetical protein